MLLDHELALPKNYTKGDVQDWSLYSSHYYFSPYLFDMCVHNEK
jgi:hypothetical protein